MTGIKKQRCTIIRFPGDLVLALIKDKYKKLLGKDYTLLGFGEKGGHLYLRITNWSDKDRLITFGVLTQGKNKKLMILDDIETEDVTEHLNAELKRIKPKKEVKKEEVKKGEKKDEKSTS